MHTKIRRWYAAHGRKDLPWRNTNDAYHIYISEIMLQQTQVATVLARYYTPFLKKFPTLSALAHAPEQDVLKMWEGLGYYQRARNLHKAAQISAPHFQLPDTLEGLLALPGIGQNTAHAILALAYHQPVAVLEANVKRVVARYFASPSASWEQAEALLDRQHPFIYNQAMMDIGALLCTPKTPKCSACPLQSGCRGQAEPLRYPLKKIAPKIPVRERSILVAINKKGEIGLAKKEEGRLLSGLYGFPQAESAAGVVLGEVIQKYSHFTLKGEVVLVKQKAAGVAYYSKAEIAALPLSKLDQKVLKIIDRLPCNRQN